MAFSGRWGADHSLFQGVWNSTLSNEELRVSQIQGGQHFIHFLSKPGEVQRACAKGHPIEHPTHFLRGQTKRNPRQQDELTSQSQVTDFVDKMLYKLITVVQGIISSPQGNIENEESKNDIFFWTQNNLGEIPNGEREVICGERKQEREAP